MHTITMAVSAREHSDRGAGCKRHPADGRPPLEYAGVVTPVSTQSSHSALPHESDDANASANDRHRRTIGRRAWLPGARSRQCSVAVRAWLAFAAASARPDAAPGEN